MTNSNQPQTAPAPPAPPAPDLQLAEYHSRADIDALARRCQAMLPSWKKLTPQQAWAAAQYALLLDANPFRGEMYAWQDPAGNLILDDGYKILVRWAKQKCPYTEKFEPLTPAEMPDGAIGYRCYILRSDAHELLTHLITGGATWREAYDVAAHSAIGIVTKADRINKNGQEMQPPKGWTWDQVARKRALKNALNLSHGAPSPSEIYLLRKRAQNAHTTWRDYDAALQDLGQTYNQNALDRLAELHAAHRNHTPDPTAREQASALLFGDDADLCS